MRAVLIVCCAAVAAAAQDLPGKKLFAGMCAGCHGADAGGTSAPLVVGDLVIGGVAGADDVYGERQTVRGDRLRREYSFLRAADDF